MDKDTLRIFRLRKEKVDCEILYRVVKNLDTGTQLKAT